MADDPTGQGEWMLRELQHRMKNMAAVIRSLARRTAETSESLEHFKARFDGRLGALIRTHSAMSRNERGEVNLEEIIGDTLQEQAPGAANWSAEGAEAWLPPAMGDSLALLFHELAVESVVGGALGNPNGELRVSWGMATENENSRRLILDWRETGLSERGPSADFEFARELLDRALPYQFGADAEERFGPEGRWLTLRLPLPEGRA